MNVDHSLESWLKSALRHHREGRLAEAESSYRKVLNIDSSQPDALSLLATILMERGEAREAEALFLRHLTNEPNNAYSSHNLGRLLQRRGQDRDALTILQRAADHEQQYRAPIYNDMATSLNRLQRREEALLALDDALSIDPYYGVAYDNRGLIFYDCCRYHEAIEAHQAAYRYLPVDASIKQRVSVLHHLAEAAYQAGVFVLAERTCESILEIDMNHEESIVLYGRILFAMGRDEEALFLLNNLARKQGLVREGELSHPTAVVLILGGVGAEHTPTPYIFDPNNFTSLTLTLVSPDQPDAPLGNIKFESLTEADIIFNALGEVEKNGGHSSAIKQLAKRLGKPLLNSPEHIAKTGRDSIHELLSDIQWLILPRVRRLQRSDPIDVSSFSYPMLIRPCGYHGGKNLELLNSLSDMRAYLSHVSGDSFFLTDFYDTKDGHGYYRKYRFIFIDQIAFPYHLAITTHWLVHYWRGNSINNEWMKNEEECFLSDWRKVFGSRAASVIDQIGRRMDLDYCGLDCTLLPSGEVLFFEANACMLVHLEDSAEEFPYKHKAVPKIRDAMTKMLARKTGMSLPSLQQDVELRTGLS